LELQDKLQSFETELNFIVNPQIRLFAEKAIGVLPDYFFHVEASSSKKYHSSFAAGEGGLLRHSQAATRIAVELFRTELWEFTQDEKDLILVGLMIHDGLKRGFPEEKYSRADHLKLISKEVGYNKNLENIITGEQMYFLRGNLEKHMGKWVQDYKTKKKILDKPTTTSQRFTSLCDYLASRKLIEINFEAEIAENE
jgi:hypothetical protein